MAIVKIKEPKFYGNEKINYASSCIWHGRNNE